MLRDAHCSVSMELRIRLCFATLSEARSLRFSRSIRRTFRSSTPRPEGITEFQERVIFLFYMSNRCHLFAPICFNSGGGLPRLCTWNAGERQSWIDSDSEW